MISRRSFLQALAALPVVGRVVRPTWSPVQDARPRPGHVDLPRVLCHEIGLAVGIRPPAGIIADAVLPDGRSVQQRYPWPSTITTERIAMRVELDAEELTAAELRQAFDKAVEDWQKLTGEQLSIEFPVKRGDA